MFGGFAMNYVFFCIALGLATVLGFFVGARYQRAKMSPKDLHEWNGWPSHID
jgi:hypothetical protein